MENEIRRTEDGKMYWNGEGAYEAEYQRLYDELVPASGRSNSFQGEVMRAVSRMYYEYYNNGNCNACSGMRKLPVSLNGVTTSAPAVFRLPSANWQTV